MLRHSVAETCYVPAVRLTPADEAWAARIADAQIDTANRRGIYHRNKFGDDEPIDQRREGQLLGNRGELGYARTYGLEWHPITDRKQEPDEPDFPPDIQVRTSRTGRLYVYEHDLARFRYVLIEALGDELTPVGWMPGAAAKRVPIDRTLRKPCHAIRARALRPMHELIVDGVPICEPPEPELEPWWEPRGDRSPPARSCVVCGGAVVLPLGAPDQIHPACRQWPATGNRYGPKGENMAARIRRRNAGTGHAYYDTAPDGTETKLDGVTTLLRDGIPKGGLTGWAAAQAAGYAVDHWGELGELGLLERGREIQYAWQRERDRLAARGIEIHAIAERLSRGEDTEVPDELAGHVESCVAFLDAHRFVPVATEAVVVNRSAGYAGTLDAVGDMHGARYLIDYKTGASVYAEHALQLAAYAHAEHYLALDETALEAHEVPMAELGIERGAVVHLRSDGFDVYPMRIDDPVFTVFRHVAYVARWVRWDKDTRRAALDVFKGEPLTAPALRSVS